VQGILCKTIYTTTTTKINKTTATTIKKNKKKEKEQKGVQLNPLYLDFCKKKSCMRNFN